MYVCMYVGIHVCVCVCFEGNLGETAEKWDRINMGVSEFCGATLSRNWNWKLSRLLN